jgi:hypothetical protein
MPSDDKHRAAPKSWKALRAGVHHQWLLPALFLDWLAQWATYFLSKWSILELLEYCGSFSILIAVIFYFIDAPERTKLKHYQAWQVINTAQGKGGSGGRVEALHELNEDGVPLIGVDVSGAFLQNVRLEHADLSRANFSGADMRGADLNHIKSDLGNFNSTNLRQANLKDADLSGADFSDADLNGANLQGADLNGVILVRVDLRGTNLSGVRDWKSVAHFDLANIHDVRGAPDGLIAWAMGHGAVDIVSDKQWNGMIVNDKPAKDSIK